MEQKENKQKTQVAEEQVSCPPQQPVEPHPFISVIPLAVLITLIVMVVKLFPDDALAGASQVALMIATAVCVALGMGIYNMKWNIFEEMIKKTVGDAGVSILILLLIGMMSATWMISGVVPTLIYYGVQIMSPTFFLPWFQYLPTYDARSGFYRMAHLPQDPLSHHASSFSSFCMYLCPHPPAGSTGKDCWRRQHHCQEPL